VSNQVWRKQWVIEVIRLDNVIARNEQQRREEVIGRETLKWFWRQ
jgi:hypothetical protein